MTTADNQWIDEVLLKLSDQVTTLMNKLHHKEIDFDYANTLSVQYQDEAKAQIIAKLREARLDEEQYHMDKLISGKWISYATEVDNRIKELQSNAPQDEEKTA